MTEDIKRLILPAIAAIFLHGIFLSFKIPEQQSLKPILKGTPIKLSITSINPKIAEPNKKEREIVKNIKPPPKVDKKQVAKSEIAEPKKEKNEIVQQETSELPKKVPAIVKQSLPEKEYLPIEQQENNIEAVEKETIETPAEIDREEVTQKISNSLSKTVLPNTKTSSAPIQKKAAPIYRQNRQPTYPVMAKRRGHEGEVLINVLVDEKGRVAELNIKETSGHNSLDRAAIKSVKEWQFSPATVGVKSVATWVVVPIIFQLN